MPAERAFNALCLDIAAFAKLGGELSGEWAAETMDRLAQDGAPEFPASRWKPVSWRLRGRTVQVVGGETEVWMDLAAHAEVHQICQRCLRPVAVPLDVVGSYRFVRNEALAAELDADSDDDVLVISQRFDAREWVEDELLLALPIVPMHEVCPEALQITRPDEAPSVDTPSGPNPFAVLARLKRKGDDQP